MRLADGGYHDPIEGIEFVRGDRCAVFKIDLVLV